LLLQPGSDLVGEQVEIGAACGHGVQESLHGIGHAEVEALVKLLQLSGQFTDAV
jgi:hypothetical protein